MADDLHPESPPWLRITGPEWGGRYQMVGFDELYGEGVNVHIERMHDGHYWMCIEKDGKRQRVEFWSRGRLHSGTERDG
jgi:hypothetical protein